MSRPSNIHSLSGLERVSVVAVPPSPSPSSSSSAPSHLSAAASSRGRDHAVVVSILADKEGTALASALDAEHWKLIPKENGVARSRIFYHSLQPYVDDKPDVRRDMLNWSLRRPHVLVEATRHKDWLGLAALIEHHRYDTKYRACPVQQLASYHRDIQPLVHEMLNEKQLENNTLRQVVAAYDVALWILQLHTSYPDLHFALPLNKDNQLMLFTICSFLLLLSVDSVSGFYSEVEEEPIPYVRAEALELDTILDMVRPTFRALLHCGTRWHECSHAELSPEWVAALWITMRLDTHRRQDVWVPSGRANSNWDGVMSRILAVERTDYCVTYYQPSTPVPALEALSSPPPAVVKSEPLEEKKEEQDPDEEDDDSVVVLDGPPSSSNKRNREMEIELPVCPPSKRIYSDSESSASGDKQSEVDLTIVKQEPGVSPIPPRDVVDLISVPSTPPSSSCVPLAQQLKSISLESPPPVPQQQQQLPFCLPGVVPEMLVFRMGASLVQYRICPDGESGTTAAAAAVGASPPPPPTHAPLAAPLVAAPPPTVAVVPPRAPTPPLPPLPVADTPPVENTNHHGFFDPDLDLLDLPWDIQPHSSGMSLMGGEAWHPPAPLDSPFMAPTPAPAPMYQPPPLALPAPSKQRVRTKPSAPKPVMAKPVAAKPVAAKVLRSR